MLETMAQNVNNNNKVKEELGK
jgi:hypothetical protein